MKKHLFYFLIIFSQQVFALAITLVGGSNPTCFGSTVTLSTTAGGAFWFTSVPNSGRTNYVANSPTFNVTSNGGSQTIYATIQYGASNIKYVSYVVQASCGQNLNPLIFQGAVEVCGDSTYTYYRTSAQNGGEWQLTPAEAGTITNNNLTCEIKWNSSFSGMVSLQARQTSACCGVSPWSGNYYISVHPKPAKPTIINNAGILTSDAVAGNQWYDQTGIVSGETNQTYVPQNDGVYFSVVRLSACNSDTSNKITLLTTGINTIQYEGVNIYPNPTNGEITIKGAINNQLIIFDQLGRTIFQQRITQQNIAVNLKNYLESGIYFINISDQNGIAIDNQKVILQ